MRISGTAPAPVRAGVGTAVTAFVAGLVAGCGAVRPSGETPRTRAVTAAVPATPARVAEQPSAPAAQERPADGTDLAACADGACEVEVRTGDRLPIDRRFGLDVIVVESLGDGEITLALQGSSGRLRASGGNVRIAGSCVNGRCHDEGELTLTTSRPGRINDILLCLAQVDADRAVLVLTPRNRRS